MQVQQHISKITGYMTERPPGPYPVARLWKFATSKEELTPCSAKRRGRSEKIPSSLRRSQECDAEAASAQKGRDNARMTSTQMFILLSTCRITQPCCLAFVSGLTRCGRQMCLFIKPSLVTTTKKDLSSMGNNEEEEEAKISPPSAQPSPAAEKPVAQGAAHNSRTIASQSRLRISY